MKVTSTYLSYYLQDKQVRQNIRALTKFFVLLFVVVTVFAVLFHLIMLYEGQEHSWVTGFYWTLTVMSTLGFGDITFTSDLGRLFSIIVLITGIILLLVVLPFAFIRYFYAPWLDARLRMRAPRKLPAGTSGHIIIARYDAVTQDLIDRFVDEGVDYCVIEPDVTRAASLHNEGLAVVSGEPDDPQLHAAVQADHARLLLANHEDTRNTNITLTAAEAAPGLPIVAFADNEESVDVLELSGATHVLPLKKWLGEQLASRVGGAHARPHIIGHYEDLSIAEMPVRHTPLVGKTLRETRLREVTGISIIGVWERGRIEPARPDLHLSDASVPIIVGTDAQFEELEELLLIYDVNPNPVLVIGGGRVGRAAARALRASGTPVNIVERDPTLCNRLGPLCDEVYQGDAADYTVLMEAGLREAPSVVLTTHDDAMNIYLTSYCRRLNPELRIVSRITLERNLAAIHRAGADFALSYDSLTVNAVVSILKDRELVVLGEGVDLFTMPVPRSLAGQRLADSGIGAQTGLIVIGIQKGGQIVTNPPGSNELPAGAELVMLGSSEQRHEFMRMFH